MSDVTGKASSEQQAMAYAATATTTWLAAIATSIETLNDAGGTPAGLAILTAIQSAVTQDMIDQLNAAAGVSTEMAAQTT